MDLAQVEKQFEREQLKKQLKKQLRCDLVLAFVMFDVWKLRQ